MNKVLRWLLPVFLVAVISFPAYGVDGYKDLKFGISAEAFLAKAGLGWSKQASPRSGVDFYGNDDFRFADQKVSAGAFFINNAFLRFVIVIPINQVRALVQSLSEKFGPPSDKSPQAQFEAVDKTPNTEAYLAFDQGTVVFKIRSDEMMRQQGMLIYSSPEYEQLLVQMDRNSIKDDL